MKKTFFVVILVVILSGCQLFKPKTTEQSAVVSAQSGVAGIVAHTQSAECAVVAAKPHTNAQGKVSLETATAEHAAVIGETDKVSAALDKALTELDATQKETSKVQGDYVKLTGKWYVRWGQKIERWFWYITIGWFVFCALAIWAQMNPIAITAKVIKTIAGFIPFTYVASLIGKWGAGKRKAPPSVSDQL